MVKNGKTILSGIDPALRAEKIVDALLIKDKTLYVCPSPVYGYGLSSLISRLEKEAPSSAVLCVEADSELYEISSANIDPLLKENRKFFLTNNCDMEKLCTLLCSKWSERSFRRVEMIRLNGGWQLFSQLYDSICDQLRREIASQWSNALTLNKLGRLFIRNMLRNLYLTGKYLSINNLTFGSVPVLVLGAGPSLDDVLEKITADMKNPTARNFKIICVDTCLGALKDRGIIPDLAVILESQHWNLRDFIGCRLWNVNAAVDLSSLPASAALLAGDGFLFFTPWTALRIFERLKKAHAALAAHILPEVFPPLGSVGLTAVEIARRLTSGKIICAGLDFSFTADKYHARSTPGHRNKLNTQNRFKRILNTIAYDTYSSSAQSKTGKKIYTSPAMKNYRNLFEQEFGSDPRIFDIEGSGLPLGIKTLSINETINLLNQKEIYHEPTRTNANMCKDNEEQSSDVSVVRGKNFELNLFFQDEEKRLVELRDILTGEVAADTERLFVLLNECDYLWGHFPDYSAGSFSGNTGGRNPGLNDLSFLKRVRAEIDPMLKLMKRTLREININ